MNMAKTPLLALALTVLLLLGGCGTGDNAPAPEAKSLHDRGMELVAVMDEMIRSETYIQGVGGSAEIHAVIYEMAQGDYTSPRAVYAICIPDDLRELIHTLSGEDFWGDLSPSLRDNLGKRLTASVVGQLNAAQGVTSLAASSLCVAQSAFVDETVTGTVMYLYVFEEGFPILVTFTPWEGGAVTAGADFLLYEDLDLSSAEALQAQLSEALLSGITVEAVAIP